MSRAPARAAPRAVRRAPAQPARRPAPRKQGPVAGALKAIPLPHALLRRARNWSLLLILVAAIGAGVVAMGVPQMIGMAAAHGLGRMGFVVRNVQITGRKNVDADAVYRILLDTRGQDMPLVDLGKVRADLLTLGWIEDARVSRRLPDTLAVDIVERAPAAVLQRNQQLSLIDAAGHVLAPVDAQTMPVQLPLVIGDGVEAHIGELQALVASQPSLKSLIEGATWVGDRRWELRFSSGEALELPEGADVARSAYAVFAQKDQQARLLGQGYARIDMRDPKQMVVRTSRDPGAKIDDPAPPPTTQT
jgi:cell division protein FtsQ